MHKCARDGCNVECHNNRKYHSLECYKASKTSIVLPTRQVEEKGDASTITQSTEKQVMTLAELVQVCEIDTNEWEVERWIANTWAGKYQVKAWLKRRVVAIATQSEIASLLASTKESIGLIRSTGRKTTIAPTVLTGTRSSGLLFEPSIPDLHAGKLAWGKETGNVNYDTKIAREVFEDALSTLIYRVSGHSIERVVFPVGNDLLNADNVAGTTTAGTPQDTDSRYQKTFAITRLMMTSAIERLRTIAPVDVVMVPGNHDCHDDATEALTQRGWLKYSDIRKTDSVLSLNSTGQAVWSKIAGIVIRPHTGKMVTIESAHISACVTPKHRVVMRDMRHEKFDYCHADTLPKKRNFLIPVSGGSSSEGVSWSDDQIALAGWILTDGSIRWKGKSPSVSLYQSKDGTRIDELLGRLGLAHKKTTRTRPARVICGRAPVDNPLDATTWALTADASRTVLQWVPCKGEVPEWGNHLNARQFQVFLDAVVAGDGHWTRDETRTSAVVHGTRTFLESLQAVVVQHGWRAWISMARGVNYRLNISKTGTSMVSPKIHLGEAQYTGDVWCLIVPHQNFMVRRGGKPHFSGNCLSVWHLGHSLECYFHTYPDVQVFNDPRTRKYYQWGKVMLMFTHGDKGKHVDYPIVMASEEKQMWADTTYREAHCGHVHKTMVNEYHGVRVRVSPALCPPDAWHAENMYTGQIRGAEGFLWDKQQGLVNMSFYAVPE